MTAKHHYVYALTDPRVFGAPFYVGKGSGDRQVQHFRSVTKAMAGEPGSPKHETILAIRAAGLEPGASILSHHDSENSALAAEKAAIKKIGRDKLTNKSDGGEGNRRHTPQLKLTGKQETFCQLIVSAAYPSVSAAYRVAYDCKKMAAKTVNEAASRAMSDSKIVARLAELRAPVVKKAQYDLAWCLDAQAEARDLGLQTGNAGAASAAAREIGKLGGLYPSEKTELLVTVDVVGRLHAGRDRIKDMKVIN
jgi:hypothetical protein